MTSEASYRLAMGVLFAIVLLMRAVSIWNLRRAVERFLPDTPAVEREGRGMFGARFVLFFALLGFLVAYFLNPSWVGRLQFPLPGWLRWTGFVLGLTSLALLAWTQAELGSLWSAQLQTREEHRLVTTGPYSRVRHPLNTAVLGLAVAFPLLSANWGFTLVGVLSFIGVPLRVPREEQMMLERFGDEYRSYMARTGRYWPK